jgi:hypothetical protein
MLRYFAALDDYRFELYDELQENNRLNLFPALYNNHIQLAKSKLMQMGGSYNRPDTVVFLERLPVKYKDRSGFVYFFKYKVKKDDNSWKIASAGIIPSDPKKFDFGVNLKYREEMQYDFTEITGTKIEDDEPIKTQLQKALRKMQYSKRNSAAEFYQVERNGMDFIQGMRFDD